MNDPLRMKITTLIQCAVCGRQLELTSEPGLDGDALDKLAGMTACRRCHEAQKAEETRLKERAAELKAYRMRWNKVTA